MKIAMPTKRPAFGNTINWSSSDCHVTMMDTPKTTPVLSCFAWRLKPLKPASQKRLQDGVERAVEDLGNNRDVTIFVTLPGFVYWPKEMFVDFIGYCQFLGDVERLCTATSDCIVLFTTTGTVVTIRIFGNDKAMTATKEDQDESFDSFVEEEGLTQEVLSAVKMTPQKKASKKRGLTK
ncbi:hypothetical protein SEMRO_370_G128380.1 [Seminavis robusta]|uniref:Uncharacterized protein n=1 Tax=Seminavis robusta TaxID=568900 RepID=A0A9N8HFX5_9STRA|nr:hypothetical protein SEMRO_370_G128380.1 [Seminavis robusta]|eukprot:Sro370_g128380.1 n/a (179) ;mRNA; r:15715-16251